MKQPSDDAEDWENEIQHYGSERPDDIEDIQEENYSPSDSFFGLGVYEQAQQEEVFQTNVRKALQLSFRTYGIERTEDLIDTFYHQTPGTASRVRTEYRKLLTEYIAKGYEA